MKKISVLSLTIVLCFSLCACSSLKSDKERYVKNRIVTSIPSEIGFDPVRIIYEFTANGLLISEKGFVKRIGNSDYTEEYNTYYRYNNDGKINYIEYSDGNIIKFNEKYEDDYCICSASSYDTEFKYTYKNNILVKKENIDNVSVLRSYYDNEGNLIKSETSTSSGCVESMYDSNGNNIETTVYDSTGKITEKFNYVYNENFLVQVIQENIDSKTELHYSVEKIDKNSYKSIQLENNGNYILYVFDDYGNLIENSSYSNGELINKTEYEWVNKN